VRGVFSAIHKAETDLLLSKAILLFSGPNKGDFYAMLRLTRRILALALLAAAFISFMPAHVAAAQAMTAKTPAVSDANLIDINTASADQLKAIKGVGDAYSKRIIDGRPYTAKNQLVTRGILPAATYKSIQGQIVARSAKK
jgi:competence protein ComEA